MKYICLEVRHKIGRFATLVDEPAFPLAEFICNTVHVKFGDSDGVMPAARRELPYHCKSRAKSRDKTSQMGSNVTVHSHLRNTLLQNSRCNNKYANNKLGSL